MSKYLQLNTDFLDRCSSEYNSNLNPYIFDTIHCLRDEYSNPIFVTSEEEILKFFSSLANHLREIHITNEAVRIGKQPDLTRGRLFKFDLDEIALIIHAFIPMVQLSLTQNTKKYDLAVYNHVGPREGTYQYDNHLIESIIYKFNPTTSKTQYETCMRIIGINAQRTTETNDPYRIAVGNGLYNKKTKTLEPFTPEHVTTTKIATNYNPQASNVILHNDDDNTDWDVESWLEDLSGGLVGKVDHEINTLFWQIIASVINPKQVNAKAIFFYSSVGNNGKGTYGQLLKNLVGVDNYSSLPIPAFKHEYMKEQLLGKTLNIADENPVDVYLDSVQDFKAVITGDDILINRKFEKPIAVQVKAINIQMLNGLPKTRDKSDSFYRRLIIVPFSYSFTNNGERPYIKHDYMYRTDVLEYVLKKALELDPFSEFTVPSRSEVALNQYKEDNNSAVEFWNYFENQFAWDFIPQNFLYKLYVAWFQDEHGAERGSCFSKKTFLNHLENHLKTSNSWEFYANRTTCPNPLRINGRMDADEPLITEYKLTDFYDPDYKGPDLRLKRQFQRVERGRGIIRVTPQNNSTN